MQDVIQRLEQRLGTLDSEYSLQIAGLRASYQLSLEQAARGVEGAGIGLDEGVRQRYKAEIQQLRVRTSETPSAHWILILFAARRRFAKRAWWRWRTLIGASWLSSGTNMSSRSNR
jgi:hypothetical protein